jgi:5-dehydro-2-deoxygluconokinase
MSMTDEPTGLGAATSLDVITIGRCSVDLYGQQIGSRLEDITSFAKSVGGCPANIAIGTARLGLRSGLVTRVGDEQLGRFIREQMAREGVALDGIRVDPTRLTALAILSVENDSSFPLLFYRDNCADAALDEDDIEPDFIKRARAIVVTGTHFAKANTDAAQRKAIRLAKAAGAKVVFDIDYRPNLWGLAGLAAGEERYIRSDRVSAHLQAILPGCDLVVGTQEEIHIAAGEEDTLAALRKIRSLSKGLIVLKRGPMGCVVFPAAIPDAIDQGIVGRGFPIEVYNVLGAGDAFMSGFLRGWLTGESLETAATFANACGAFAVSRLLCSPEIPTWEELRYFLEHGSRQRALRKDAMLNHVHWATTRREQPKRLMVLAIDERAPLEEVADRHSMPRDRVGQFEVLGVEAVARVAKGRQGFGVVLDCADSAKALFSAQRHPLWIGRAVEKPGAPPLGFDEFPDLGSHLVEWPVDQTIKCRCFYDPDDDAEMKSRQDRELLRLHDAARTIGRELLIEISGRKRVPRREPMLASVLSRLYEIGVKPDWWALAPQPDRVSWSAIEVAISTGDPHCRGVLLSDSAPPREMEQAFRAACASSIVRGFLAGRLIVQEVAQSWFAGRMDDEAAIASLARGFAALVKAWNDAAGLNNAA